MTHRPLLDASAHAFALVSFADAELSPAEEKSFATFIAGDPDLKVASPDEIAAAWAWAIGEVKASQSFGAPLVSIRIAVTSAADKATVMRAAQAAVVADGVERDQEDAAVRALAEALGLNPNDY
ncbi:MAG: TerB family tellurite resistance protein [Alphaproteobacteria bacterium]